MNKSKSNSMESRRQTLQLIREYLNPHNAAGEIFCMDGSFYAFTDELKEISPEEVASYPGAECYYFRLHGEQTEPPEILDKSRLKSFVVTGWETAEVWMQLYTLKELR